MATQVVNTTLTIPVLLSGVGNGGTPPPGPPVPPKPPEGIDDWLNQIPSWVWVVGIGLLAMSGGRR